MTRFYTSIIVALLLVSGATAQVQGPQSYNTALFGTLNPAPSGGFRAYSALTGYAAPDGREYALLGGYTGTHIIDVTESPVRQVAFIPGPQNGWREMKTYGTHAYIVSEGGAGLQIVDLSRLPASATLVNSDTSRFHTAHTITQHGSYLYVNGTGFSAGANGGTMIFDLSRDPVHPELIGTWTLRYVHDCTVRNDTMYAAAINNGMLDIVYLGATQTSPRLVASIEYPGAGTHNADLTPDGSYVMTTDEVGSTPKTLKVWDVRDMDNITKVKDWTPAPGEIIHNVHSKGAIAFISWYTAGTRIVDMSDPLNPAELGFYDTYEGASSDYAGNWEVYPYLPSGKILASDMSTGLHVFTFNGARRGMVHGTVSDAVTGEPVPGAVIELAESGHQIITDQAGRYSYAGAVGTQQFRIVKLDYLERTGSLEVKEAGNEVDIRITPLPAAEVLFTLVDAATGQEIPNFAYRVVGRPITTSHAQSGGQSLKLPKDSSYNIYIGAWGYLPRIVELVNNQGGQYQVLTQRGYADNVEMDLGWSLAAPGDDAGPDGRWQRGVPMETTFLDRKVTQPGNDNTPEYLADHAFITGLAAVQGNPGAYDVDDGATTLTSPAMDLSGYDNPIITCAIWYSRDARMDVVNDTLDVLISGDGGASWQTMARITESPERWRTYYFRLRDFILPAQDVRFRLVASDHYEQSLVEAGLDDFLVSDSGKPVSAAPLELQAGGTLKFGQIRPNPFTGSATLDLELGRDQRNARLELFDALGRRVAIVHEGAMPAGVHAYPIDGASLAAGQYVWRLTLDDGGAVTGSATLVR